MKNQTTARIAPHRNRKFAKEELKTLLRRRAEHFRVLAAVTDLLPKIADADGQASGAASAAELAKRAGVSGKAVNRALRHWQRWRVLWIHWRRGQIRFERTVVEKVLAAWTNDPHGVASLLHKHRAKREGAAPRPRVPKTPSIQIV
jgi:hypothetical protein